MKNKNPLLKVFTFFVVAPLLFLIYCTLKDGCPYGMAGMVYGPLQYISFGALLAQIITTILRRRKINKIDIILLPISLLVILFHIFSIYFSCRS